MKILKYTAAIILLSTSFYAFGQKGFSVGVNGGVNNTYILDKVKYGDVDYKYNLRFAPYFGLAASNNFTDMIGVEIEANRASLGQDYSITYGNGKKATREIDLNYFQVPVLLKITGGDFKSRFSAMFGPQWGFLSSARITSFGDSTDATKEYTEGTEGRFKKGDFGIMASAGGDITLHENFYLNLGLRMYYGLATINSDSRIVTSYSGDKLANAYFGVNVGIYYLFRSNETK